MEYIFASPLIFLDPPNLKLKKPSWLQQPSAMVMYSFVLLSYFLVTGGCNRIYCWKYCLLLINDLLLKIAFIIGIIYDVIIEPPSVGSTTDEHGHSRPVYILVSVK